ncbi:DoxX family protein [bacterium]|nr:MAG: DoxX family protein [bacterium]
MSSGLGLLIPRLMLGLGVASHGAQKLFGWFGGGGPQGTGAFMESLGMRPGERHALLAGFGEFGGGLLTAVGFLNPIGPALIVGTMTTAIATVHWKNGYFASKNGSELPLMNIAGATALAFSGPGGISIDAAAAIPALQKSRAKWCILLLATTGALVIAGKRTMPPPASAES